jgi:hypothetical protein
MAQKRNHNDEWTVPGTVLAGFVVVGVGFGFLLNNLLPFTLLGVGVGLFASAWLKSRRRGR